MFSLWRRKPSQAERADALWRKGSALLSSGKSKQALAVLRQAAAIEPSRLEGRLNLGTACYMEGLFDEAINHLRYVLAIDPTEPMALLNLAACHDAKGDLDTSIQILEQLVQSRPKWRDAHYNLAIAYLKRNLYEKAEDALRAELQINRDHEAARTLLNQLYLRLPRKEKHEP
ncbi:MAG: tetratricopeptide repeat protein [Abditibacteriales bacterium]|nr:tetratricopeptide repeat protein [Abditibacteriales bacterium]MDW8365832.1 tetratricopeptide repeat protein [Abditibacteriales bacterium]